MRDSCRCCAGRPRFLKKLLVLPTWLLYRAFIRLLPPSHPWREERRTLRTWALSSTTTNDLYSGILWAQAILTLTLAVHFREL
jgi:hypothetical protein